MVFQAFKKGGFVSKLPHIFRMFKSYKNGAFKMDFKNVLIPVLAIVYFISPINISFEWIPFLGQIDDLAILAFVIPMLVTEQEQGHRLDISWVLLRKGAIRGPWLAG